MSMPVTDLWTDSNNSPRVEKLRKEYFSFYTRDYYRNEVTPFSTGEYWDEVFSPYNWTVVPEVYPFIPSYRDTLKAMARTVPVAPDFYRLSIPERRAAFLNMVLERHLDAHILEGELIVGSNFSTALSRNLSRKETKKWRQETDAWLKTVFALHEEGIGNVGAIPGHLIPDYKKILDYGFKGVYQKIQEVKALPGKDLSYLNALEISTKAPRILAARYESLLKDKLLNEKDTSRRQELEMMLSAVQRVPWEPPLNFHQAVQALWFTHMLVMAAESYPGAGLSYGRIDQYLYPFYQKDINEGVITREFAGEILKCFFIKHNYAYDYQGRVGRNQGINSSFGQLITLGGMGAGGEDLTNGLTLLMLDVIEELNMLEPKPNFRLHQNTPDQVMKRVVDIITKAQGAPLLLNFDETAMRAMECTGISRDLLWDYAPVGCLENTLQGNDRSGTVDVNLNLPKALELVLNDGRDPQTGRQIGPRTGNPELFKGFEDFQAAFEKQMDYLLGRIIAIASEVDRIRATYDPTPYLSLLVDGCIDNTRDITAGGARYNFITVEGVGLATMIDSLAAVRELVFKERSVAMSRLVQGLKTDFSEDEALRQMLLNKAPKYGNNHSETDLLGKQVSDYWSKKTLDHYSPKTGRRFRAGYLSWNYWISYAPLTAATPDGRRRFEPLSNGVCCVNGMDKDGPTSAILSVGNLDFSYIPNGGSHTMSFSPSLLRDEEHKSKFVALLRTYAKKGGTALQINIMDPDTLREAQKNPDLYPNLLVRVTGYNAYFVNLGKAIQDEIIKRESH
ncbi:MAG: pyruvate formate lyase family protein [Desulfocucumaceae bacterium]